VQGKLLVAGDVVLGATASECRPWRATVLGNAEVLAVSQAGNALRVLIAVVLSVMVVSVMVLSMMVLSVMVMTMMAGFAGDVSIVVRVLRVLCAVIVIVLSIVVMAMVMVVIPPSVVMPKVMPQLARAKQSDGHDKRSADQSFGPRRHGHLNQCSNTFCSKLPGHPANAP